MTITSETRPVMGGLGGPDEETSLTTNVTEDRQNVQTDRLYDLIMSLPDSDPRWIGYNEERTKILRRRGTPYLEQAPKPRDITVIPCPEPMYLGILYFEGDDSDELSLTSTGSYEGPYRILAFGYQDRQVIGYAVPRGFSDDSLININHSDVAGPFASEAEVQACTDRRWNEHRARWRHWWYQRLTASERLAVTNG